MIARKFYSDGMPIKYLESVKDALGNGCEVIDEEYLKTIYLSLWKRFSDVRECCGAFTDY